MFQVSVAQHLFFCDFLLRKMGPKACNATARQVEDQPAVGLNPREAQRPRFRVRSVLLNFSPDQLPDASFAALGLAKIEDDLASRLAQGNVKLLLKRRDRSKDYGKDTSDAARNIRTEKSVIRYLHWFPCTMITSLGTSQA